MAKFTDLPSEIWVLIASFIPKSQLFHLKSLSSFFLNCWMDRGWKDLLIRRDASKYEMILQRVWYVHNYDLRNESDLWSSDPFVATRTRNLTIEFGRSSLLTQTIRFLTLFKTITALPFAKTLQQLTLRGNVEHFAGLGDYLGHTAPFETLTKFSLILDSLHWHKVECSLPLIPIFRSLAPTLQHLFILNLSFNLDLSSLFNFLSESTCYPKLTSFELEFTIDPSFQYSCQSILRFLLTHNNNLQLLDLQVATTDQKHLDTWLANLANAEFQFSSLQTLGVSPSMSQTGLSAVLALIKRTAPTLLALWIDSRTLTFEEVEQVVDALTEGEVQFSTTTRIPRRLKSLSLRITQLSVPFLDLLARKLPQLEELELLTSKIVGSDQVRFLPYLISTWLYIVLASCSIHFTIFSTSDVMTPTHPLLPKTTCIPGSCAISASWSVKRCQLMPCVQ